MKITEEVTDIVFRNEDNGYSVMRCKSGLTVTGVFAFLTVGQELILWGEYVNNAKYGKQFKANSYEVVPPNSPSKIKQFIGSGLIEGVGPVTAERIVKLFGADTLRIMEEEPQRLSAVKGISAGKATAIGEKYAQIKDMQAAIVFLQGFDITLNMAVKIYKHYGVGTVKVVQTNPYSLIEKIDGVGFLTADKIAAELGHDYAGTFRVRAGVVYVLRLASDQDGHTFLPKSKLIKEVCKLLRIKMTELEPAFDAVLMELCLDRYITAVSSILKEDDSEEQAQGYMLTKFYIAEKAIATKLCQLAMQKENKVEDGDFREMITHYEELNKIKLHTKQVEAVRMATTRGVSIITGGPGTGKTTIVKAILYINQVAGLRTQLLAPTGRAAKRLEGGTGYSASTIHRALSLDYGNRGGLSYSEYDEETITADVVIVDEFSMCDVMLVSHLLKKVLPATRLVFVGDVDQLASVGAGNVLSDIIGSGVLPVALLSEIYRQSEASQIVLSAHAINNGRLPDLTNKSSDFFFESSEALHEIKNKVVSLVSSRIPKFLNISHAKIQVLCPMKAGDAGMNSLNIALQESLNPSDPKGKAEYEYNGTMYRVGDRVMQTHNNYQQEWQRDGSVGEGVFNGDIGSIVSVNRQNGEVVVELEDGRITTYKRGDLSSLVLAYAITVHKSQGCEFDVVIIPVTSGAYMILTRNLLYTAVTRAKKMVVLVGDSANIEKMVRNTYTKKRYTLLREMLSEIKKKTLLW